MIDYTMTMNADGSHTVNVGLQMTMFKLSILEIILAVAAVGCGPAAALQPTVTPNVITTESKESVQTKISAPQDMAATPSQIREAPVEGWPNRPLDEACGDISINALSWAYGSAITVHCQTQAGLPWSQMVNLRDLGFLVP